jgi:glycosyltransferase involved in cell wall biosynthesis
VRKALRSLADLGVAGEVVVSDNGSTDGSQRIATENGARVVNAPIRGYGGALMAGIEAARGKYVIMADADDSYDLSNLGPFVEKLREGHDVVMGNRFKGGIAKGAMPPLHRYLGNPVLSRAGRWLFGLKGIGDFHCGIRGFDRDRIRALGLCMPGMEFASELVVRAAIAGYDLVEVPTTLQPDGRSRPPHLRTWRDGWRHLRFMLLFSPWWLFAVPGLAATGFGLLLTVAVGVARVELFGRVLHTHFALLGSALSILGLQITLLGMFAKAVFVLDGIGRSPGVERLLAGYRLELALLVGAAAVLMGVGIDSRILWLWIRSHGGQLDEAITNLAIIGGTLLALGVEVIFSAFFLSILKASRERRWT